MYYAMVEPDGFQLIQNFPNLQNLILHNSVPAKQNNKHISMKKISLMKYTNNLASIKLVKFET